MHRFVVCRVGAIAGAFLLLASPALPQTAKPASAPLVLLGNCADIGRASPAAASAIRAADDQLAALALATVQLNSMYRGFIAACPAFLRHEPENSPAIASFRDRVMDLTLTRGVLEDKATALRALLKTAPLVALSKRNGKYDAADYCAFVITTTSADLLNAADALVKRSEVDCPAGK